MLETQQRASYVSMLKKRKTPPSHPEGYDRVANKNQLIDTASPSFDPSIILLRNNTCSTLQGELFKDRVYNAAINYDCELVKSLLEKRELEEKRYQDRFPPLTSCTREDMETNSS
ncbi:hypothetical protein HHI36_024224 [Cryptolaemus montrouzieri]|uniref:Uncharacterized protein n=1 Tax=Cryptolaemus montrouzieri TaxID=559131 RepID=A0ABD2NPJ2_9CUCU